MDYSFYISELARRLDFVVVSVDYRLAPEFPLQSTDDCYTVTDYIMSNPSEFNAVEETPIILA